MRPKRRRGMILLLVLVVVAMLAAVCLGYSELMLGERRAAQSAARQSQARVLAQSGVELVRQFLDRASADQTSAGGLIDNPQRFSGVLIIDDDSPQSRGRCSVVAPRIENGIVAGVRYGLQDESTRINLATILQFDKSTATPPPPPGTTTSVSKTMLMALPGMADEVADAILDWIDSDDTPRTNGAETDYYAALSPAYTPRNGPPVTIEELLSVRGVTPELLFGRDAALMGLIPASSVADGNIEGVDNSDGSMDHGWAAYLTLWSAELNTTKADGTPKIDLNGADLQKLNDDLVAAGVDKDLALFIVAYRANGPSTLPAGAPTLQSGDVDTTKMIASPVKATKLTSILDVVGASVAIPPTQQKNPQMGQNRQPPPSKNLASPLTEKGGTLSSALPLLLDNATTQSGTKPIYGRININQASRVVLMCIPGMTSDIADQIVANRGADPLTAPTDQKYEVWPLIEGLIPLKTMKAMQPYVTTGGNVYRAQVMGYFDKGGPVGRVEAIFDSTQHPTKLLFWKDISRSPAGFPVEPVGQVNGQANQSTN